MTDKKELNLSNVSLSPSRAQLKFTQKVDTPKHKQNTITIHTT